MLTAILVAVIIWMWLLGMLMMRDWVAGMRMPIHIGWLDRVGLVLWPIPLTVACIVIGRMKLDEWLERVRS